MEEVQAPPNCTQKQLLDNSNRICQQITAEIIRLKGHSSSRSFFVSTTHQFLEKLIHLHCTEIKHTLTLQAKKFQQQFREGGFQVNLDINSMLQELREVKDKFVDKQLLVVQIDKLFGYLICIQCQGKSNFEVENIFLEINCSLNYACPLCIKQMHSNEPKSIKFIKNQSEEPETHIYPRTMKTISLKEPDRPEKLPSISKQSRLESLLDSMKAERAAIKKQEDSKQRKINKIWNLLGNLIQLDRQKFIVDHIFNQHEEKENRLLKQLQQKNVKNKHYISHFCKKKRPNLKEPSPQKIFEDFQDKDHFEKALSQQRKVARSVSPKYPHRKLSVKKHVKILQPINSNINSIQLNSEIKEQKSILMAPDIKPFKFVFIGENQTLRAHSKQVKSNYFHRTFKSSKDMLATLPGDSSQFCDNSERPLNKSLKMI